MNTEFVLNFMKKYFEGGLDIINNSEYLTPEQKVEALKLYMETLRELKIVDILE